MSNEGMAGIFLQISPSTQAINPLGPKSDQYQFSPKIRHIVERKGYEN